MTSQTAWQSVCVDILVSKSMCLLSQPPLAACQNEVVQVGKLGHVCSSRVVASLACLAQLWVSRAMQSDVSLKLGQHLDFPVPVPAQQR